MDIENNIFKRYTPDFVRLKDYGFIKQNQCYFFEKSFRNDGFKAVIKVFTDGAIIGKVYDLETNDEFLPLKVEMQQGAFVGEIREEFEKVLIDIRDNCFSKNYFMFPQSNRITNAIIKKYGNAPNFMWEQYDDCGVFKNSDTNKWYGIIMNINYSKLGENSKKTVEIINVKLDKDEIQTLLKQKGFYPAWHMNKKSWITITLDDTLPDDEIMVLIDESYSYTIKH